MRQDPRLEADTAREWGFGESLEGVYLAKGEKQQFVARGQPAVVSNMSTNSLILLPSKDGGSSSPPDEPGFSDTAHSQQAARAGGDRG